MIDLFKVHMPASVMQPLEEVLLSGFIGQGQKVKDFESSLGQLIGNPLVLTVNSGTSAIHLALRLAGVGRDDEVITTPMTCTATNEPILERGAKIVWADINAETGEIDPEDVVKKITARTKAIICVHWGGYPCDVSALKDIADSHGIKVIEDAAHAMLSTFEGAYIGTHSDFVCFSFQAIKHLTTVDGGALFCRNKEDYDRGKLLRWYGLDRESSACFRCKQDIQEYGYKFHMNDVNATIGIEQLKYVNGVVSKHIANADYYNNHLRNSYLLNYSKTRQSAYWIYSILVEDKDRMQSYLNDHGIMSSPVHSRNDRYKMTEKFYCDNLPGVDYFAEHQLAIPVGWWLTKGDCEHVAETINKY